LERASLSRLNNSFRDLVAKKNSSASKISKPDGPPQPLLIVGVGASAGGFEAFQRLIENVPADSTPCVVFILHLLPTHKSMLTELLSKMTAMTVTQAADGMKLEPSHVYVIPPDVYLEMSHGRLKLVPRGGDKAAFLPIDRFFGSLAGEAGERSIGVILSGMGSDGAIGLRQIKEAGGVTFCQSPEGAERDEMPRAAMATGDADFVLPPAQIGAELVDLARHPYVARTNHQQAPSELRPTEDQFQRIFALLRTTSGIDFSHYKRPTIERRLLRRMALQKITSPVDYIEMLEQHPQEANQLYRDILIHVTFFFREPASFATLNEKAFPKLFEQRKSDDALRIWVPGCSSGEEPYSIAITLAEFLAEELQSTNEELDTAKEELQSTNEELNTLNAELHSRNEELSRLNSDLINLLSSVELAVIMVDRGLCIRRFTPVAEKLFNLIATDVGRPMQHIKPNIVFPDLEQRTHEVIEKVVPLEEQVQDTEGVWYLLRVRPYCTLDNRIDGAVIALLNVDAVKRSK
jgi:hypothetical protein